MLGPAGAPDFVEWECRVRVLLANKFFFRNGGSEVVMFDERDFLRDSGVEVVDFAMDDRRNLSSPFADFFVENQSYASDREGRGAAPFRTAVKLIHSSEAVRKIGDLIERTHPDLVHCHNIYHQLTPSIIGAAKRRGVPTVLTLHDYKPVCPVYLRVRDGAVCSECIDRGFSRVLVHRCADGSLGKSALLYAEAVVQRLLGNYEMLDAIIAPSEFMRSSVTRRRFDPEKVSVIHNGVDTHSTQISTEDGNYVLFMGRLSSEKGIETLLEAHSGIADRVRMKIAGTGPMEEALRARYPSASFLGHLTGADLKGAIARASLVVVPSNCYENCPMSVLEAMAYGKAVVGSDIGGIPELVVHGETGLLFPPGDLSALRSSLLQLMEAPELRRTLGVAGRKRVEERFSRDRHNAALMRLYKGLMKGSKRVAREVEPVRNEN